MKENIFKSKITKAGLLATSLILSSSAFAVEGEVTLPAGMDTAFDTLMAQFNLLLDKAWPVVIGVTVAFVLIKLFKRLTRVST